MPPPALHVPETMTDTLTPDEAARLLANASRYEDALAQRTEGLTAMVWGICTSALFLTYGFADVLDAPGWALSLLWLPWVGVASVFTYALWRSAALSLPRPQAGEPRGYWWRIVAATGAVTLVFALLRPDGPLLPLAVIGALWTLMPLVGLLHASPPGRVVWLASGLACLVAAGALALADAGIEVSGTASILVPGIVPVVLGLRQTLRG